MHRRTLILLVLAWAAASSAMPPSPGRCAEPVDASTSTEQLLERARESFLAGDYPNSETLYKNVLVREPGNLAAMQELAILYEKTGRLDYARGLLTRASIIAPDDPEIIQRLNRIIGRLSMRLASEVDSLLSSGEFDAALPRISILLTAQPENAELYFKRAECHVRSGRPAMALDDIRRALDLKRDERFLALRRHAEGMIQGDEITRLTAEAREALSRQTPEGQEDALQRLGRVLEVDPANKWARDKFKTLAANVEESDLPGRTRNRLDGITSVVRRTGRAAGRAIIDLSWILNQHLGFLFAMLAALLITNSPLTHALVRGFSPRQALSGRLRPFGLNEVLMLINNHAVTGILKLRADGASGRIYIERGEICHCTAGRERGFRALRKLLSITTEGTFVFSEGKRARERTIDTPLTLILMELPEQRTTAQRVLHHQKAKQSKMKSLLDGQQ